MDSSAYSRMFDGLAFGVYCLLFLAPLGLWKLVEIIIWIIEHVRLEIV